MLLNSEDLLQKTVFNVRFVAKYSIFSFPLFTDYIEVHFHLILLVILRLLINWMLNNFELYGLQSRLLNSL